MMVKNKTNGLGYKLGFQRTKISIGFALSNLTKLNCVYKLKYNNGESK